MIFLDLKRYRIIFIIIILIFIGIVLLNNSDLLLEIAFPIHYDEIIYKNADAYGIDPYLVAAIIKVESKYYEKAVSHKNARGLMQISSITGKWAADELEIKNYNEDLLFIPNINIKIGCWYVNQLKKEFNNDIRLILAAYNGGSGNVSKWLKDPRYSKNGQSLDDIPFVETKEYVKKVLKYYKIYSIIYE